MEKRRGYLVGPLMSLLLCMLPLPFLCGFYPVVHFTEEQIDIRVYPDQVIVDGYYVYQNPFPFPVSQGFTIPFPVDDRHPAPSSLQVRQLEPEEKGYRAMVHAGSSPVFPALQSEWRLQSSRPVPAEGYGEKRQLHSGHDQTLAQAFAACGIQDVSGRGRNIGVKLWTKQAGTRFSGIPKGELHAR